MIGVSGGLRAGGVVDVIRWMQGRDDPTGAPGIHGVARQQVPPAVVITGRGAQPART
jgi:hypothetical protein